MHNLGNLPYSLRVSGLSGREDKELLEGKKQAGQTRRTFEFNCSRADNPVEPRVQYPIVDQF